MGNYPKTPQQWQADFEMNHGPIADLVALLRQNCNTYQTISDKYGVTREMVRQWRNKIAPWFDLPTEKYIREKTCTLQRLLSSSPPLKVQPIFEALKARGLTPKLYITRRPVTGYRHLNVTRHQRILFLNGYKCRLSWTKALSNHPTSYWHVRFSKHTIEPFILVFLGDPIQTAYVFPRDFLLRTYPLQSKKGEVYIFIPLSGESSGYRNHFSRIHWPDYKEAWHLLERGK